VIAALLLAAALAGNGPAAGRDAGALVLVVRAGALEKEEMEPHSDLTPGLRWLAFHGAVLPRVSIPGGREEAATPALLKQAVLPPEFLGSLREQGVSQVVLFAGEEDDDAAAPPRDPAKAAPPPDPTPSPSLVEFRKRFGAPPPLSPQELPAMARLEAILGLESAAGAFGGGSRAAGKAAGARDAAPRSDPAVRAREALEKGARLVVLLDQARDSGEDKGARRRDALLEALREQVLGRDGAHLGVLSLSLKDASPNAVFVIHGPAVRSGWVIPAGVPAPALGAALFRILGCRPPDSPEMEDVIHGILREGF
jgi:hypothetical protein